MAKPLCQPLAVLKYQMDLHLYWQLCSSATCYSAVIPSCHAVSWPNNCLSVMLCTTNFTLFSVQWQALFQAFSSKARLDASNSSLVVVRFGWFWSPQQYWILNLPFLKAVSSWQNPAGADEDSSTEEVLSRRPAVLHEDGSLPWVSCNVCIGATLNPVLASSVLPQAAGGCGWQTQRQAFCSGLLAWSLG